MLYDPFLCSEQHSLYSNHLRNWGTEPALVVAMVAGSMWWVRTGGEDSVEQVLE